MKIRLEDRCVELRPGQTLRADGAVGTRVVCLRGELWITQHADLRDVMVAPDQSFTLDRSGVALISALQASSVLLVEPQSPASFVAEVWRSIGPRSRMPGLRPAVAIGISLP